MERQIVPSMGLCEFHRSATVELCISVILGDIAGCVENSVQCHPVAPNHPDNNNLLFDTFEFLLSSLSPNAVRIHPLHFLLIY
jgi:hypothetical protein